MIVKYKNPVLIWTVWYKYTFSSVFPNKEVMDEVFKIIKQNKETDKNEKQ